MTSPLQGQFLAKMTIFFQNVSGDLTFTYKICKLNYKIMNCLSDYVL